MENYEWKLRIRKGYNPDQPRVPAGSPRGGQWTSSSGGSWNYRDTSARDRKRFEDLTIKPLDDMALRKMFHLEGYNTEIQINITENNFGEDVAATINVVWTDSGGMRIGQTTRVFEYDTCYNESLEFVPEFQNKGLARSLYERQIEILKDARFLAITLVADISIGRYAWAKMGFDYESEPRYDQIQYRGQKWLAEKGVKGIDFPSYWRTAEWLATWDPGPRIKGAQIDNPDVPPDMEMPIGKAFMLDKGENGHGEWEGILYLR